MLNLFYSQEILVFPTIEESKSFLYYTIEFNHLVKIKVEDDWQEPFESNCYCPICKVMAEGRYDEKSTKDACREANFKHVIDDIDKNNKNEQLS